MSSGLVTRTTSSSLVRRLTPWAAVLLVGALLMGVLPSAQAQTGANHAWDNWAARDWNGRTVEQIIPPAFPPRKG